MTNDNDQNSNGLDHEQLFKAIVDSAEDYIFCKDRNFRYTFANRALLRLLDKRSSDVLGKTPRQVLGDAAADAIAEIDDRVLKERRAIDVFRTIKIGDKERLFHTLETPLYDENENIVGLLGVVRDVSQTYMAEQALRESEENYRTLSETIPLGIVIHKRGVVLAGNARVFEMFGYQREELVDRNAMELVMAPECHEEIYEKMQSGHQAPYEVTAIKKDGTRFPIEVHTSNQVYKGQDARVAAFIDISERRQSEHLLRIQRDLSLAVSTAQELKEIWICLLDHVLGMEGVDAGGVYLRDGQTGALDLVISSGLSDEFVVQIKHFGNDSPQAQMIGNGEPVYFSEEIPDISIDEAKEKEGLGAVASIPLKHEDQAIAVLNCSSKTQSDFSENTRNTLESISGMVGGAITRIQTEKALHESEIKLHQSEKMRAIGQLAGGIAHDFNNQLVGISGFAEILKEQLSDEPKLSKFAGHILTSSKRAADLTSQLLAFARKGKYLSKVVDVHKAILEVTNILEHSIDKRIVIAQTLNSKKPCVKGDPSQLQNAILNLSLNARDAMTKGGILEFTTELATLDECFCESSLFDLVPGDYLQIKIIDSGTGMSKEVLKRIFEPFFTTKPQGQGAGMGLAAVYGTVKNHRGSVVASSVEGSGTVMTILLPSDSRPVSRTVETSRAERGSAHILLVDDEVLVCEACSTILERLGYKVTVCSDGMSAVTKYKEMIDTIDLVILDMVMPEMTGSDAFLEIQEMNPDVKVLLSSGYSVENDAQALLDKGASDFIQKPFKIADLSKKIITILSAKD